MANFGTQFCLHPLNWTCFYVGCWREFCDFQQMLVSWLCWELCCNVDNLEDDVWGSCSLSWSFTSSCSYCFYNDLGDPEFAKLRMEYACVFPFTWWGNILNECTTVNDVKPLCSRISVIARSPVLLQTNYNLLLINLKWVQPRNWYTDYFCWWCQTMVSHWRWWVGLLSGFLFFYKPTFW